MSRPIVWDIKTPLGPLLTTVFTTTTTTMTQNNDIYQMEIMQTKGYIQEIQLNLTTFLLQPHNKILKILLLLFYSGDMFCLALTRECLIVNLHDKTHFKRKMLKLSVHVLESVSYMYTDLHLSLSMTHKPYIPTQRKVEFSSV